MEASIESLRATSESEITPLLAQRDENLSSSHWKYTKLLGYLSSATFVILVGIIAGNLTSDSGRGAEDGDQDIVEWRSQMLGYLSAILYRLFPPFKVTCVDNWGSVASRVPQIGK
jgi:hypothetical protein